MSNKSLTLTKIPHLNLMVLRQRSAKFFVAAPNSFIIDKAGFLQLIDGALSIGFVEPYELMRIAIERMGYGVTLKKCMCDTPSLPIGGSCCEVCKGIVWDYPQREEAS